MGQGYSQGGLSSDQKNSPGINRIDGKRPDRATWSTLGDTLATTYLPYSSNSPRYVVKKSKVKTDTQSIPIK